MSTKIPFWDENLELSPFLLATLCVQYNMQYLSLLLWDKLAMAILVAGGSTLCAPLISTLKEGFLGETVALF